MQNGDEFFMRQALDEARKAFNKGEVPIGAVVVYGDRIVGRGHNLTETLADPTAHAEMQALTAASSTLGGKYLRDCTLYVTLEPCPMCAGAIAMSGIDEVLFGAYDPRCGCAGSLYNLPEDAAFGRVIPCSGGLMEAECQGVLDAFFDSRRG